MRKEVNLAMALALVTTAGAATVSVADDYDHFDRGHGNQYGQKRTVGEVQLGPRPFYLVQGMDEGKLKDRLMQCQDGSFSRTDFLWAIAAPRSSFPSTRTLPTWPGRAWVPASSSEM